jgi:hypothetical protein
MPSHDSDHPRRASLEVLRAEAAEELSTVVFERLHGGEDPWAFMEEIPTVDELVIMLLRAERIVANHNRIPTPEQDYRILRQIALAYPELTTTVWAMLDRRMAASA